MSEKSANPGFLATGPKVKKTDRRILMAIMAVFTGLMVVLMFGLSSQKETGVGRAGTPVSLENENKPLAPPVEGLGLALPIIDDRPASKEPAPVTYVGPPTVDPDLEAARREADEIRRRKFERAQQAYSSVLLVKRDRSGPKAETVDVNRDGYIDPIRQPYSSLSQDGYDPAADQDKEAFFVRADSQEWLSPYTREAGRKFELKTGTVIPGVMVSGVNSDLPGSLIAQVTQNVYDTAKGHDLLLPQGAKLYGVYDSRVVYGQQRVLIAWNRVVFPDGSSVTLGAMPGTDMAGYAGFNDKVDNHYLRIFGSAIMMSLITGGMSYAVDQTSNSNSGQTSTTMQDEMISALAAQLGQTTLQLLQKNLNIKPTLEIRLGYQFNVIVTKDMVFRGPYAAR